MIKKIYLVIFFTFIGIFHLSYAQEDFSVLYQSRFRPAQAYARVWLQEIYHGSSIKQEELPLFHTHSRSALDWLWQLNTKGFNAYLDTPLFWIPSLSIKDSVELPLKQTHFTYRELNHFLYNDNFVSQNLIKRLIVYLFLQANSNLSSDSLPTEIKMLMPGLWVKWQGDDLVVTAVPEKTKWVFLKPTLILATQIRSQVPVILKEDKQFAEGWLSLIHDLTLFTQINGRYSALQTDYLIYIQTLQQELVSPSKIEEMAENKFPLGTRLKKAGSLFYALPSRYHNQEWYPINALNIKTYDPITQTLLPVKNFTLFSDLDFEKIRQLYGNLEQAILVSAKEPEIQKIQKNLSQLLINAYLPLAGTVYQEAHEKILFYPTRLQLKLESLYFIFPWIGLLISFYFVSACLLLLSQTSKGLFLFRYAHYFMYLSFLLHTFLLAVRCYVLMRPPVSNMFETVLYVPWITTCFVLIFPACRKQFSALFAACLSSIILLLLLRLTDLNEHFQPVQAVLDSQFWLSLHVMMIVGSYGLFILAALLAHFYLVLYIKTPASESLMMKQIGELILQSLYVGTTCLVVGTLLGGVWAAESWGRFWDWDPKESWAFISSCLYIICIHAYRFHYIKNFGLSVGSIAGLLAISFTWYGVNYILGTGLHSYGFGFGGEGYYYSFILLELIFLSSVYKAYFKKTSHERSLKMKN